MKRMDLAHYVSFVFIEFDSGRTADSFSWEATKPEFNQALWTWEFSLTLLLHIISILADDSPSNRPTLHVTHKIDRLGLGTALAFRGKIPVKQTGNKVAHLVNRASQTVQRYRLSPEWRLTWRSRLRLWRKTLSQSVQLYLAWSPCTIWSNECSKQLYTWHPFTVHIGI